ncbi:hypothetical protein VTG60DRAFT_5996 [Thermothelomyces hinnuleus]
MAFAGQNWKGADFYPKDSPAWRRVHDCLERTNWDELCSYATELNHGLGCHLLSDLTNGLHHVARVLEFENGSRWLGRIQMAASTKTRAANLQNEIDAMMLIRERTRIPVPRVFGYRIDDNHSIGAAFILTEFLPGNVAIDLDGAYATHQGQVPTQHRKDFYRSVARIHVQMASLRFHKIGTIVRAEDGSYTVGPFTDIGGPFDTATDFFEAWANHAKFPLSPDKTRKSMQGGPVEEVLTSILEFPSTVRAMAHQLSSSDQGPFPVVHADFFHSNIIVDQGYNILGVIDWEGACTVPWELVEFPLFLETVPRPMDAPWNYDDKSGQPLDEGTRLRWQERSEYTRMVAEVEKSELTDSKLSETLADQRAQNLAYALRVYRNPGKLGFYTKIFQKEEPKDERAE